MEGFYEWYSKTNKLYILLAIIIIVIIVIYLFQMNSSNKKYAESFDTALQSKSGKVTLFYTNSCGWSRKFLPEWNDFVKYANDNRLNIITETVDCEQQKERCSNIPFFPCVVITLSTGQSAIMDDKYPRTKDGLIRMIAEKL